MSGNSGAWDGIWSEEYAKASGSVSEEVTDRRVEGLAGWLHAFDDGWFPDRLCPLEGRRSMSAEQDVYPGTDTPEWNEFRRLFREWLEAEYPSDATEDGAS